MRHRLFDSLTLVLLATLTLSARPAGAQTVAAGPYYATPSWDQTLPANTRFIVLSNFNNEAVLDRETGLVWERSPGPANQVVGPAWELESDHCLHQTTGNRAGWRLPTINELASLFDPSATSLPGLPAGHPFTGFSQFGNFFPSSTVSVSKDTSHRGISFKIFPSFSIDFGDSFFDTAAGASPWCVRGGLNSSPQ